jgi:hypothetical protein
MENLNVTVLNSKPSIFDRCEKEFGISWDNTIFAYSPNIHSKFALTDDLIEHELVHIQQQSIGVEKWWQIYFDDPPQRLAWELEAYRVQYQFLKRKNTINKSELFKRVEFWASNLSGKSYGYLISLQDAIKEIMT